MEDRATTLKLLRPPLGLPKDFSEGNEVNLFQTEVLRPILKFQNKSLVEYFQRKAFSRGKPRDHKHLVEIIKATLTKDLSLKNILLGMVVGLFTDEELAFYIDHQKEINKRIISMLKQRLESQLNKKYHIR